MPGNQTGQKNQALISGRIAYGYDGADAQPLLVDTAGKLILPASTVSIGKVVLAAGTAAAGTVTLGAGTADIGDVTLLASTANVGDVDTLVTETIQAELIAQTAIAASVQLASTVLSVVGIKKVTFFIDHARAGSAAFTVQGTEYRIEASEKASGNDSWRTLASVLASSAVAQTCAASGDYAAGAGTITILSGTALTIGDVYYWVNAVAASSEWMKVTAVSGTVNFNILDGLTNAQTAASIIVGKGEHFVLVCDVEAITRVRAVVNNNASSATQAIYSRIAAITEK